MEIMNNSQHINVKMKAPPPKTLSAEELGVWTGWNIKKDREVVREAAVKGLHIELAISFLSVRKQRDHTDTQKWFMDEVNLWIIELLTRQQIYRASHILKNVKLDVEEYFKKLFSETKDSDVRNYIGNHLIKTNSLDTNLLDSWNLLKQIEKVNSIVICSQIDKNCKYNVLNVENQSSEWKAAVSTELFFQDYDTSLTTFLNPDYTWKYLMQNQMLDCLKLWINVYFLQTIDYDIQICDNLDFNLVAIDSLKNLFLEWPINESMIEYQSSSHEFNEIILNELSTYGIFGSNEKNNLITIMSRISDKQNIQSLLDIINLPSSVVNNDDFHKLLVQYCLDNKLYCILCAATVTFKFSDEFVINTNSKHLKLWQNIKDSFNKFTDRDVLRTHIINVVQFLSSDSIDNYFISNPLIFFALIVFTKDLDIFKLFSTDESFMLDDTKIDFATTKQVLDKLPFVRYIFFRMKNSSNTQNDVSFYDLLEKHSKISVSKIYNFRFEDFVMPHFNEKSLVQKFGFTENLDYTFYLNRSRPSAASLEFTRVQLLQYGVIDDIDKYEAKMKAHELALDRFYNSEVTSSCVSFIEMIGEESDLLRVHVTVANILRKNSKFDNQKIIELFRNVYENAAPILAELEDTMVYIYSDLSKTSTAEDIVTALKYYSIVVSFAKFHNLPLPEKLLKHCAENNIWLTFLVFVQYYNYPVNHIQSLLSGFQSKSLVEHLEHAVMYDIRPDEQKSLLRERHSRKYLLSKIGVQKSKEDLMATSATSSSSTGSLNSSVNSELFDAECIEIRNTNLLQVLIRCHNSVDPPKALLQASQLYKSSLLPVLATCYEPDSIVTNWLIWLSISADVAVNLSNIETVVVSSIFVTEIMVNVLKSRHSSALTESFKIFLQENPLNHLADFLHECVHYLNFKGAIIYLDLFKTNLQHMKYNSVVPQIDYEMTYLSNRFWLETTAIQLICTALGYCFNSRFHQIQFLQTLCAAELCSSFTSEIPNFSKVLELLNCLPKTDTNLTLSVIFDSEKRRNEVMRCVELLTAEKLYDSALKLALLENVGKDHVLLEEWDNIFKNNRESVFCERSHEVFKKYSVFPISVVQFYERCYNNVEDVLEKYEILKTAFHWIQFHHLQSFGEIEKDMWLLHFTHDEVELNFGDFNSNAPLILSELLNNLNVEVANCAVLDGDKIVCLENTIDKLLDCGNMLQALRLEKIFVQQVNTNLEILKTCLGLAEGTLLPFQLNTDQRLLLSSPHLVNLKPLGYRRRTFLSPKVSSLKNSVSNSSLNSTLSMTDSVDTPIQDILSILETLSRKLKSGFQVGQKILMYYRIAVNTGHHYNSIVKCSDSMNMIKNVLQDSCVNKLELLHDCITVYEWPKKRVADFLCEEIILALNDYVKSNANSAMLWDLNLNSDFHLILQLLPDQCTLLGLKLFTYANALYKLHTRTQVDECDLCQFTFITELFIRAHDCFTADCNMEGISTILRKAQKLIMVLLNYRNWQLMVRLLTGVGRYTEMNYVFEILKEHDQFEHLLRKGHRNDNNLKVALLEFLKNRCPENRELYRNVALYFTLFSEVAELWEVEAQSIMRKLITISKLEMQNNGCANPDAEPYVLFSNTDGTKICLNRAMINYTHATEYHLQGERLASAMKAAKQAELLALQLSTLKDLPANATVPCLLNLNETQLGTIVSTNLSFQQTLLLVQSYNFHPDWATVIYEQYVVQGQSHYLDDFLSAFPLTDSLAYDITRKFVATSKHTPAAVKAVKNILVRIPSVHTKYRLASELAFADIVESLLAGSQLAYLRDTVWKKGFKQK